MAAMVPLIEVLFPLGHCDDGNAVSPTLPSRRGAGGVMLGAAWSMGLDLGAVLLLVLANGFFVAAEFALVSVRRNRIAELVANDRTNAGAQRRAADHLGAHLAATQLSITLGSLTLGWIGEPALAHLIEPALA